MGIVKHTDLQAGMRNGAVLRSDVYHPDEDKTFPILLCRTL
jgi:predicted acyl esterase